MSKDSDDDDVPIAGTKSGINGSNQNPIGGTDSSSDSESEESVPIAQIGQTMRDTHISRPRTKNASFPGTSRSNSHSSGGDSSDSDDSGSEDSDLPMSNNNNNSNSTSNSNNNSNNSNSNSNSNNSNKNGTNTKSKSKSKGKSKSPANGTKSKGRTKKSRRFVDDSDSESGGSSSDDSSSDDGPVVPAAQIYSKPPERKRRRISSGSPDASSSNSPILRNNNNNSNSNSNSNSTNNKSNKKSSGSKSKSKNGSSSSSSKSNSSSKSKTNSSSSSSNSSNSSNSRRGESMSGSNSNTNSNSNSPRRQTSSTVSQTVFATKDVIPASKFQVKTEIIPLETDKNAIKWWDRDIEELLADTKKWHTLDHNGVVFAPEYVAHNIKMKYNGKVVDLTPDQEEIATMYAVMLETDWITKPAFQKNFMVEFKKLLNDKKQTKTFPFITDLSKCDFKDIYDWYQIKKESEKELKKDKEYKERLKIEKEELDSKYGYALVDGIKEKVGNYKVEPPGLFRGRGEHPKMGMLKKRLQPEDVILNIGKNTKIPPCPIKGHDWGGVIHDQSVTYIAKWIENINGQHKFVYLHSSSRFKGESDLKKYEKARTLKKHVDRIRSDYASKLASKSVQLRQLATSVWIIDHLSIRVGNEKDTDEEADTVGVCSLRIEHMKFDKPPPSESQRKNKDFLESELTVSALDHNQKTGYFITLDFLGKDSMRYHQRIEVPRVIYMNLKIFCDKKKSDQDIFHKIDPNKVNDYLKDQMPGLTAKVFRTHNASVCLQNELSVNYHKQVGKVTKDSPLAEKLFFYNACNRTVAILCNHQKTVSKGHAAQLEKMNSQIEEIEEKIKQLECELKVSLGKKDKSWLKHDVKKIRSPEQIKLSIEKKKEQLRKKELSKNEKKDNKEVALGTSKINYMDPRITVSWCKKMEVPIEKVFNKSLLDKFPWAMNAKMTFEF